MTKHEKSELCGSCAAYFRQNRAYDRSFEMMRRKWRKYGRIAGTVKLEHADGHERETLERFLGKNFFGETIRFSMAEFDAALQKTKFQGVALEELLDAYFGETIITTKAQKELEVQRKEKFFQTLFHMAEAAYGSSSRCSTWLFRMKAERKYGYHLILNEYAKDPNMAQQQVETVCRAVEFIKNRNHVRLAVLGAEITQNPHAFDRNTVPGRLLIQALSCLYGDMDCQNAENILSLYYTAGIKPDDISSFTTVYGIHFYTDGKEHPAYLGFIEKAEPYIVTLSNLSNIEQARIKGKNVYVVENQMVFSYLCEALKGREAALVCTSGQLKTASLILLDLLSSEGYTLYYSGDFDPEGLGIAEKVIKRSNGKAKPWHMSKCDYEISVSNENIRQESLRKLEKIDLECLSKVKAAILENKKAGYQEQLLEKLLADILTGDYVD